MCTAINSNVLTIHVWTSITGITFDRNDLNHLILANCPLTSLGVQMIARSSKQLQHISFYCCSGITDLDFEHFVQNCNDLRTINLTGCIHITDFALRAVITYSPLLSDLILYGTSVTQKGLQLLLQSNPSLRVFTDFNQATSLPILESSKGKRKAIW